MRAVEASCDVLSVTLSTSRSGDSGKRFASLEQALAYARALAATGQRVSIWVKGKLDIAWFKITTIVRKRKGFRLVPVPDRDDTRPECAEPEMPLRTWGGGRIPAVYVDDDPRRDPWELRGVRG